MDNQKITTTEAALNQSFTEVMTALRQCIELESQEGVTNREVANNLLSLYIALGENTAVCHSLVRISMEQMHGPVKGAQMYDTYREVADSRIIDIVAFHRRNGTGASMS